MRERFSRDTVLTLLGLFFLTVATRIPFTSKFLYHIDSVNYALALERYDITVHQPHPPGYFLYVMLGRLFYLFIGDANAALVTMSIVFSGLTVVVIYLLTEDMYDSKTGGIAACFAITSPNLWFHGEVALSYGIEAFFSALVGWFCWKLYTGRYQYIWISVLALGIAGGIRQNTVVFLFPLWLFAVRKAPLRKIIASIGLLGVVCFSWFAPMVNMTGGWNAYTGAFRELMEFTTRHNSVFDRGWVAFKLYSQTLYDFTIYSAGSGILAIGFAAYVRLRKKTPQATSGSNVCLFIAAWSLPSFIFYLLIFIHPANPGYALIFTPPLLVISASATVYMCKELHRLVDHDITAALILVLLLINTGVFMYSSYMISWKTIKNHDRDIELMVEDMRSFDPNTTVFIGNNYVFYGFRQIMYYLPQYRTYQANASKSPSGKRRIIFCGFNRDTYLSEKIQLPTNIHNIATVLVGDDRKQVDSYKSIVIRQVLPHIAVASGPVGVMGKIYPNMTIIQDGCVD
ncbi:ArnT family glycosyltransferase [Geomobilimonas luticola]|uniref:DUF2723 domain-containing protein n=1 Tax=Geomobilimonas luticola TaxID=1114878 RepID=A0ABS5SC51_9BACT|nr:DUF2723 domain-containing protein [Geomobilimonas luticola]MBT0652956.1 DUF2723 domain-containing protein [Geomobilimonas luticola]